MMISATNNYLTSSNLANSAHIQNKSKISLDNEALGINVEKMPEDRIMEIPVTLSHKLLNTVEERAAETQSLAKQAFKGAASDHYASTGTMPISTKANTHVGVHGLEVEGRDLSITEITTAFIDANTVAEKNGMNEIEKAARFEGYADIPPHVVNMQKQKSIETYGYVKQPDNKSFFHLTA